MTANENITGSLKAMRFKRKQLIAQMIFRVLEDTIGLLIMRKANK